MNSLNAIGAELSTVGLGGFRRRRDDLTGLSHSPRSQASAQLASAAALT
jgi:hypothetical protein